VRAHLAERGASFFDEIARSTRLLATQVEAALAELVAAGRVTADSFTGLRALLVPSNRRPPVHPTGARRRGGGAVLGMENAGRWSLLPEPAPGDLETEDAAVEVVARSLLRRYGVVFRRLLERESLLPPWRELARVYRRLEARGEVRGGRFVDGFSGEQWALPEAVGKLRATRKDEGSKSELVSVSAADPLNLIGIAVPGPRLAALASNRLLWRGGEPAAVKQGAEVTVLPTATPLEATESWQLQQALTRRPVPPRLRPYLGRTA
jgi:ATP-dependent Lhr-like helicase